MRIRGTSFVGALALFALLGAACGSEKGTLQSTGPSLRVDDAAPGFSLPSAQGGSVSLAEFRGHKPVLLYFSMGPG